MDTLANKARIEQCIHTPTPPMIFEEPPNGDLGAWCSASVCTKCGVVFILNIGLGEFK